MNTKPVSELKHTPTPWEHSGYAVYKSSIRKIIAQTNSWDDSAFIVRAVNAHEELLGTLRWIEQRVGISLDVKAACKEAIAKAEGDK